eukprot:c24286_g1_i1 orf=14-1090(-)
MYRPASVQLCRKKGRSGSFWFRLTWIVGYLGLGVAVMFSTLLFPVLLSIFRSHAIHAEPYKLQKLGRVDGLGWTQEVLPHLSRTAQSEDRKELLDLNKLWKPAPNQGFEPCVSPRKSYTRYNISRGYLVVHANGGLNQMRAGICDMVAVARLINATLVIPELDKRSFWQDTSNFSNVFDEEYFIKALENDLPVVRKLPKELLSAPKAHKQFRSWSSVKYYQEDIVQLWENYKIIRASKSDSRLANNNLPSDIQKLRCRVHYDALRFAPPIEALGKASIVFFMCFQLKVGTSACICRVLLLILRPKQVLSSYTQELLDIFTCGKGASFPSFFPMVINIMRVCRQGTTYPPPGRQPPALC